MRVIVEKIVFGGEGLARLPDGRVLFLPGVIPGEEVKVRIVKKFKDYVQGEVEEIIVSSPSRVEPSCPYYGLCGGCQLQHMDYPTQTAIKLSMFKETLHRLGNISEKLVEGIVPSPRPFHYRNRLRFHVEPGTGRLGFVKRKSHDLIVTSRCLLGAEKLNRVLEALAENPAWKRLQSFAKRVKLELSPAEGLVTLLFWITVKPEVKDVEDLAQTLPDTKCVFYWVKGPRPEGPFPRGVPHRGRRLFSVPQAYFPQTEKPLYLVRPGVFAQANWEINLKIMETIRPLAEGLDRVLDLHSGMGNFLLPLSSLLKEALGVDTDIGAIEDARYTAEYLGLSGKVRFERVSATEALIETWKAAETYPLVILDPPRGGCRELMRYLPEVATEKILYISCDPPTLARDLKLLLQAGFEIERIVAFDMFPQTYHLEALAVLRRS